jgi:membrane protein
LLRLGLLAVSTVLNILLFWLGLRLATAPEISSRDLRMGAIMAAVIWQILQAVGGYVIGHDLRHASSVYGTFGIVLGLIAWLHLQAQLTLYTVEADVVRRRRLWPRSLFPPPLTEVDREACLSGGDENATDVTSTLAPGHQSAVTEEGDVAFLLVARPSA